MSMTRFAFLLCGAACLAVQAAPVIYPAKGQSVPQTDRDKFACFEWSKSQSGFDPMQALATPAPAATPSTANNSSSGSNPTGSMVRGAAGGAAVAELTNGDAGKGAAVGVLGAAMRDRMKQQQQQQAKQQQAAQQQQQQQQRAQQQAASTQQRATFDRAFGACMEGRSYVVK